MAKSKKNKKKKKFASNFRNNQTVTLESSTTSSNNSSTSTQIIQEPADKIKESSLTAFYLKKDLFKIGIITFLILIIFGSTVVIDKSTSWYDQGANALYHWLRLGK